MHRRQITFPRITRIRIDIRDHERTFPRRYGQTVKNVGGEYSACRGHQTTRYVTVPVTSWHLADEIRGDFTVECVVFEGWGLGAAWTHVFSAARSSYDKQQGRKDQLSGKEMPELIDECHANMLSTLDDAEGKAYLYAFEPYRVHRLGTATWGQDDRYTRAWKREQRRWVGKLRSWPHREIALALSAGAVDLPKELPAKVEDILKICAVAPPDSRAMTFRDGVSAVVNYEWDKVTFNGLWEQKEKVEA